MSCFVFGDIHGCAKELELLLAKIEYKEEDVLIFLGDYIDRGTQSKEVLDILIKIKKDHKKAFFLKGNHEQMFLDYLEDPNPYHMYIYNGGANTLKQFRKNGVIDIPDIYVNFIKDTILCCETEEHFFVHAGVPNKDLDQLTDEDADSLIWIRDEFINSDYFWEKTIVHGHSPAENKEVEIKDNRINIDTGCVFGGKLTCLSIPDLSIFQIRKGETECFVK